MNLVTEAGQKAQAEFDLIVLNIKKEILQALENQTCSSHKDFRNRYHPSLEAHVKEALWKLIDEDKIALDAKWKLTVVQ
jgi:hypothetical protein